MPLPENTAMPVLQSDGCPLFAGTATPMTSDRKALMGGVPTFAC